MKRICALLFAVFLLAGCTEKKELETVMDNVYQPAKGKMMKMVFDMPDYAAAEVFSSDDTAQLYVCEDFILTMEVHDSGDIQKTMLETTGYAYDQLPIMQSTQGDIKRYDCVWTAAGESGDQIGRCSVLDDGSYHYVLSVMTESEIAGELTQAVWNHLFSSLSLQDPDAIINIGS